MKAIRSMLAEEVRLTYLPAEKFKTNVLSAQFVTPLRKKTASACALIPFILRRGTLTCPDMGRLSARLDALYGARIDPTIRKFGERQCTGFVASFIDDTFTPPASGPDAAGERLLEPMAALLGELICDPATYHGRFLPDYFESEKTNLLDAVRATVNDKREWAARRLLEEMCAGEPYGVARFGDEESVQALKAAPLFDKYRTLIAANRLELVYCGSAPQERVEQALRAALATLPRETVEPLPEIRPHTGRKEVLRVEDSMDVSQGKLSMGFSCDSEDHIALMMGNTLFGGSSNSKLFLNVREKLSLCYYASSVYHRQKRMITVASGIEFENEQRMCDEILAQLRAVQDGHLEEWELESARATLLNAYASMGDSQGRMENFWLGQAALHLQETPEELAEQVRNVTLERVTEAMRTVKLDTIYFLRGKEARS